MNIKPLDTLKIYWQQVRKHKPLLFLMFLALGATTVLELIVPLYYKDFFNVLTGSTSAENNVAAELIRVLVTVLFINIISWVLYRFTTFANSYLQPSVMADLSQHAFDHLMRHSHGFFTNRFVGALVRKLTRLSRAFEVLADRIYWDMFPLVIRILGAVIILYIFNHTIAYILLAWTVFFIFFNYLFSVWKLKYDKQRAAKDTETTATLADAITNQTNVQIFNGHQYEFGRFKKVTRELQRLQTLTWNLSAFIEAVQAALFIAVEFLLMYFAVRYWQQGLLTVGDFVLIQSYIIGLIIHLWGVGRNFRDIYESFADAEEMTEILNTPHEIKDVKTAKPLIVSTGKVEFKEVSFNFNKTREVLHKINLTIEGGEKLAIIGPSGAGKSTIVRLLFRFYDLTSGKILIDGQKINQVTQKSLHEALSIVPQEPILFHRSLSENIRYGRREATDKEVIRAAKLAHCDEFIETLPEKYNTFVGERGVKLSGGERQRVAIARAILKDAPILVLDEATSSLDSHSEALIQDALKTLMKNKTVVVIAHRLSTIRQMDRIVVLDNGQIVDDGTHEELLAKDGLYKQLWQLQAGGFLPAGSDEK